MFCSCDAQEFLIGPVFKKEEKSFVTKKETFLVLKLPKKLRVFHCSDIHSYVTVPN